MYISFTTYQFIITTHNYDYYFFCTWRSKQFKVLPTDFPFCFLSLHLPPHKLQGQIKTVFISTEEYHSLGCQNFAISNSANKIHLIVGVSTKNILITIIMGSVTFFDLQQNFFSSWLKNKTVNFLH